MYAHRPVIDPETFDLASREAQRLDVPTRLLIDASIEASHSDSFIRDNATRELKAWRDRSAMSLDDVHDLLKPFADDRPILVLAASSYRPAHEDGPIDRDGYGIPARDIEPQHLADYVRGYIPIRTPDDDVTVIAFRRGIPRVVALASEWEHVPATRKRYAKNFAMVDRTGCTDPLKINGVVWRDHVTSHTTPLSRYDEQIVALLDGLVLRPSGNRNTVTWIRSS